MDADIAKGNIRYVARALGFDDCRVSRVKVATHADRFRQWIADGCAGEMKWLERNVGRRVDPGEVVGGAFSVVSLAINYFPGGEDPDVDYRIARYAWNEDYHDIVDEKLRDLNAAMVEREILCADSPTVRDVVFPCGADYHARLAAGHAALRALRELHALHGRLPDWCEFRKAMGNRIYGCDDCLEICPWNRFAKISRETRFHARQQVFQYRLRDFLTLDDDGFRKLFAKSPIKRIKRRRFLRNVCVALGNVGSKEDLEWG